MRQGNKWQARATVPESSWVVAPGAGTQLCLIYSSTVADVLNHLAWGEELSAALHGSPGLIHTSSPCPGIVHGGGQDASLAFPYLLSILKCRSQAGGTEGQLGLAGSLLHGLMWKGKVYGRWKEG